MTTGLRRSALARRHPSLPALAVGLLFAQVAEAANQSPTLHADNVTTAEESIVHIAVLANDSDPDGDPLTVNTASQPARGFAVRNADNTIDYTPQFNTHGVDSFTYTARDGRGGSATATVTVNVTSVNDPPVAWNDNAGTTEDTPVSIAVLANDVDTENNPLIVSITTPPTKGTAVRNADNTVTYTPRLHTSGTDTFTYKAKDGQGGSDTALVTVHITARNDPPVAMNDTAVTYEETAVTFNPLANDSDPEGDSLNSRLLTQPLNGFAVRNADQTVTYTPRDNKAGLDTFTYKVMDGRGGSTEATVSVQVTNINDPPQAANDSVTTPEDAAMNIAVLANDVDPDDDDVLTVSLTALPTHGTAVRKADNTVTYTPDADFYGADAFAYRVKDASGERAEASIGVTVAAVDDPGPPLVPDNVVDKLMADPLGKYVNIEFSPDLQHAVMLEQVPGSLPIAYNVWFSDVEPTEGVLIPADGRGEKLAEVGQYGMAQWGEDSSGPYAVMLDLEGYLVIARPTDDQALVTVVTDDPADETERHARAFAFPMRDPSENTESIVYQVREEDVFSLHLVDLRLVGLPPIGRILRNLVIHEEPMPPDGNSPAAITSFQRWLPESEVFFHGIFEPGCPDADACPAQVQQVDTSGLLLPRSTLATDDPTYKVDAFPFWRLDGSLALLVGLNYGPDGALFSDDDRDDVFVPDGSIPFDPAQSDLAMPGGTQSFEPFVWGGEEYAVYEVVELGAGGDGTLPYEAPCEIWVVKLSDPMISCRVSEIDHPGDPFNPSKQTRVDAEPLVIGNRAWLYYHADLPVATEQLGLQLRRIDLGKKSRFDTNCAAGTAAPTPGEE